MVRGFLIAAVFYLASAAHAGADCERPRSAVIALKYADLVFRGIVHDVRTDREPRFVSGSWTPAWIVTFDVSRVWKGHVPKQFVLYVVQTKEDDAFESFERGSDFLVFAVCNSLEKTAVFGLKEPTYGATNCGGTASMLSAVPYLVSLGPGKPPE